MKAQGYFSVVMYKDRGVNEFIQQLHYVDECLSKFVLNYEIIVVLEANVTEDIYDTLCEIKKDIKGHVLLVALSYSQNSDSAIMAGVDLSIGDYVYEIDKGSNLLMYRHIEDMYARLTKDKCDIAFLRPNKIGLLNRLMMKIFNRKNNRHIVMGKSFMRLVTRRSLNAVDIQHEKDNTRNIMYQLCGLKNTNIYCDMDSKHANSHFNKEVSYFLRIKKVGSRLAYVMGSIYLLFFLGTLISDGLGNRFDVPIFLLSFGILLLLMGILSNHLLLLYREVKGVKNYIVQDVRRLK